MNNPTRNPEDDQILITRLAPQVDPYIIRRYLAARRWRENHIADRDTTYADPTYRSALRTLGSLRAPLPVPTAMGA